VVLQILPASNYFRVLEKTEISPCDGALICLVVIDLFPNNFIAEILSLNGNDFFPYSGSENFHGVSMFVTHY